MKGPAFSPPAFLPELCPIKHSYCETYVPHKYASARTGRPKNNTVPCAHNKLEWRSSQDTQFMRAHSTQQDSKQEAISCFQILCQVTEHTRIYRMYVQNAGKCVTQLRCLRHSYERRAYHAETVCCMSARYRTPYVGYTLTYTLVRRCAKAFLGIANIHK